MGNSFEPKNNFKPESTPQKKTEKAKLFLKKKYSILKSDLCLFVFKIVNLRLPAYTQTVERISSLSLTITILKRDFFLLEITYSLVNLYFYFKNFLNRLREDSKIGSRTSREYYK